MNKASFLYKYYFELPLRRETYLYGTVKKVKNIINKLRQKKDISKLSSAFTEKHNINIHILCSHWHLECLLFCLAGFYAFSKEYAEVVIHEDGTFTRKDILIVKEIFPWAKYVSLKDADETLRKKGFSKETIEFRHRKYKYIIKAVDFHHIESRERILILDTDIFLLGGMEELWERITKGAQLAFNEDPSPDFGYGGSKELLEKILERKIDINLRPCVNTGLIVEPAAIFREESEIFNRFCEKLENFLYKRKNSHCIEQGYIGCILKDKGIEEYPLSDKYRIIHRNTPGVQMLKDYDFENNPENIETIHLCQWDKLGADFRMIKKKLLPAMRKRSG